MSRINYVLNWVEHGKMFYNLVAWFILSVLTVVVLQLFLVVPWVRSHANPQHCKEDTRNTHNSEKWVFMTGNATTTWLWHVLVMLPCSLGQWANLTLEDISNIEIWLKSIYNEAFELDLNSRIADIEIVKRLYTFIYRIDIRTVIKICKLLYGLCVCTGR